MLKKIKTFFSIIAIFALLTVLIPITHVSPDHAQVYVDDLNKKYYSLPCVSILFEEGDNNNLLDRLRLTTRKEAFSLDYSPDSNCRDNDGFIQDERIGMIILRRIGILKNHSRWNDDGNWNW